MMDMTELCKKLEHFETPTWAAEKILEKEILTQGVVDPCVGSGILADAAKKMGCGVLALDIQDWGYPGTAHCDWLAPGEPLIECVDATCFMNPPFSTADQFVEKAIERKFRKIICFQRFAWYESRRRRMFWENHPPTRVYICGDRADCWRHDIPIEQRRSSTPTAHAWFIWERDAPAGTLLGHIYKLDGG